MSYEVKLRRPAQKHLDGLSGRDYEMVSRAIANLADNPRPPRVKKLRDSGLWRTRIGNFRVIYAIDDNIKDIIVVRIARRKEDTYERL